MVSLVTQALMTTVCNVKKNAEKLCVRLNQNLFVILESLERHRAYWQLGFLVSSWGYSDMESHLLLAHIHTSTVPLMMTLLIMA